MLCILWRCREKLLNNQTEKWAKVLNIQLTEGETLQYSIGRGKEGMGRGKQKERADFSPGF